MSDQLDALARAMAALPFVDWDRTAGGDDFRVVFGWVARSDGDRDFVTLTTWAGWPPGHVAAATSSAKHSRQIARALGYDDAEHQDCERVADVFEPVCGDRQHRHTGPCELYAVKGRA